MVGDHAVHVMEDHIFTVREVLAIFIGNVGKALLDWFD